MDEQAADEFIITAQIIGILRVEGFNHLIDDDEKGWFVQSVRTLPGTAVIADFGAFDVQEQIGYFDGWHGQLKFLFHAFQDASCQGTVFIIRDGWRDSRFFLKLSAGHAFDGDGNMDDQTDFGGICEVGDFFFVKFLENRIDSLNRMAVEQFIDAFIRHIHDGLGQGFLAIMEVFEIFGRRRFADEAAHGFAVVFFTARKDDAVALLLQNG